MGAHILCLRISVVCINNINCFLLMLFIYSSFVWIYPLTLLQCVSMYKSPSHNQSQKMCEFKQRLLLHIFILLIKLKTNTQKQQTNGHRRAGNVSRLVFDAISATHLLCSKPSSFTWSSYVYGNNKKI